MPIDPKGPTPKPQVWEVKPSDTVRTMRIGGSRKPKDTLADVAPKTALSTQVIPEEEQARINLAAAQAIQAVGTVPQTKAESPTLVGMEAPVASRNKFTAPATGTLNQAEVMNTNDIVGPVTSDPAIPVPQNPTVDIRSKQEEPPHVDLGQNDLAGDLPQTTPWDPLVTKVMSEDTLRKNVAASGPNLAEFDAMQQDLFKGTDAAPQPAQTGAQWSDPSTTGDAQLFGKPKTVVPLGDTVAQSAPPSAAPALGTGQSTRTVDPALAPDPSQGPVEELPKKSKKPVGGIGSEFGLGMDDFPPESESIGSDAVLDMAPEPEQRERVEAGSIMPLFTHLEALVGKLQRTIEDELKGLGDQRSRDEKRNDEAQRTLNQELKNIRDCMQPLTHATTARQDQMNTTILQNVERLERAIAALGIDATRATLNDINTTVGNLRQSVDALKGSEDQTGAAVANMMESQSRIENDVRGLREHQNNQNIAHNELKAATEKTLSEIEKRMATVEQTQKDAYQLASDTKFNTDHVRNDVDKLVKEVKEHVDAKVNVLSEKVEALPGLNSDVAIKLNVIAEAVTTLVKEAAKPKPPAQEASPQPATPAEPSAPAPAAQEAAAAPQPQAPAAPPAPPPQTPPTPPTPPAQATAPAATPQPRRRNWGFRHGIAAGAAMMLIVMAMHACGGPEQYAGHERMVFSKIEGGTVVGSGMKAGTDATHGVDTVSEALVAIAAHESGSDPTKLGDLNLDFISNPSDEKLIGPALGKYQMMTKYWPEWARLAGVEEKYVDPKPWIERDGVKPIGFRVPEAVQDQVAKAHFEERLKAKGNSLDDAIRSWNPGDPNYHAKVMAKAPVKKAGAS